MTPPADLFWGAYMERPPYDRIAPCLMCQQDYYQMCIVHPDGRAEWECGSYDFNQAPGCGVAWPISDPEGKAWVQRQRRLEAKTRNAVYTDVSKLKRKKGKRKKRR